MEDELPLASADLKGISSSIRTQKESPFKLITKKVYDRRYVPMAEKELLKICDTIRGRWNVIHMAIVHRIGEVPIGEASVIIAISSAHRRDSLEAVEYAIDELKATVPIWKREYYENGEVFWKENSECCFGNSQKSSNGTHSHSSHNAHNTTDHSHHTH
jgi:molybdopterin synthase catalytic subunit